MPSAFSRQVLNPTIHSTLRFADLPAISTKEWLQRESVAVSLIQYKSSSLRWWWHSVILCEVDRSKIPHGLKKQGRSSGGSSLQKISVDVLSSNLFDFPGRRLAPTVIEQA